MKKRLFICLTAWLLVTSQVLAVAADSNDTATDTTGVAEFSANSAAAVDKTYATYLAETEVQPAATDEWRFTPEHTGYEAGDTVEWTVSVPATARYDLQLEYRSLKKQDAVFTLAIDGTVPFREAETLTYPSMWCNKEDAARVDDKGNQFAPDQILYEETTAWRAMDTLGRYEYPYNLLLTAGEHRLMLKMLQGSIELAEITLCAPESVEAYTAPTDKTTAVKEPIIIEAEWATLKSARSLLPLSENGNASVTPQDAATKKINYIGGSNWAKHGTALTWTFTVTEPGWYALGFHFRQSEVLGGSSFRKLEIDGTVPFKEAERVRFTYGNTWQYMTFGDDSGTPYEVYLDAGEHTMTLSATTGPMAQVYSMLQDVTSNMGDLYVDITMIVGETVDANRSYELFNQIPGFNDQLDRIISSLEMVIESLRSMQKEKTGSNVSTVEQALRTIKLMRDKPYSAHRYKSDYYDAYTNLSAMMGTMTDMPLDIDRIVLSDAGTQPDLFPGFWEKLTFSFRRFFCTFVEDYEAVTGKGDSDKELKLWVMQGRDQALALNTLIQDSFVRDTGISVQVELVNATLIQAMLSGTGPDMLLQMSRTEPVNLAMRDALVDMTQFPDYEQVLTRFGEGADIPYWYDGGLYALPDTQTFYMMFLRTDILETMGIDTPQTWEEFLHAAMLLQRNNLQVSMPSITDSGASNTGVGNMSLYPTLLAQNGLSLYYDDLSGTTLGETDQMQVFTEWIQWYTKYKLPTVTDFFNRFRVGSAPIGIAPYTTYTQLKAAAPEIEGRWTVAPVPGTVGEDGSVNHATTAAGTGCAITKLAEDPATAWEFLKWWTDADTQMAYSENLESVLGPLGRVASATTEAVTGMDWDATMQEVLTEAQKAVVEVPEVPGGYYTARGIYQVYWSVVEQGQKPVDALNKWAIVVNREIARKTEQYAD